MSDAVPTAEAPARPRVYLAGPMVFYPDALETFAEMKALCARHGLEGVAPSDNQIGLEGLPPGRALITRIVQADLALMDALDGGLFCLNPFRRSTEMDPGTAVEIGYMLAQRKPMSGWTNDPRPYPEKVREHMARVYGEALVVTAANDQGGTSGLTRDGDGILVHSDGLVQNGMAEIGIEQAGGRVIADPDWRVAFAGAAADLAGQFGL